MTANRWEYARRGPAVQFSDRSLGQRPERKSSIAAARFRAIISAASYVFETAGPADVTLTGLG
jgi:hypothetical protein